MRLARTFPLGPDALMALGQILGIMSDQAMSGDAARWDVGRLMEVETRLGIVAGGDPFAQTAAFGSTPATSTTATDEAIGADDTIDDRIDDTTEVTLGIDDVALLLDGMAYTEIASAEFPWIDMVRWTSDFVTAELRQHWTDDEWRTVAGGPA